MDLSRRKFLNLFGMGAASIIIPPPKKSYFFFGNLWCPAPVEPEYTFGWDWEKKEFTVSMGQDGIVFVATLKETVPNFLMATHDSMGGEANGSKA